jgi:Ca-activated chloride channel family protein
MHRTSTRGRLAAGLAGVLLVAACGGGGAATPTPAATTGAEATTSASGASAASATPPAATTGPAATNVSTGPATLSGPQEIEAGKPFQVTWTGPNAAGDYVTIVAGGTTKWTNESYFYTKAGSPGNLVAPAADGAYALWYVSGADDSILARVAIRVTPFSGALLAPDSVMAGSQFEVAWNGPNGPQDYVTIVKAGTTKWTNESYFYTTAGSPGKLTASITPGAYEVWYANGTDDSVQAKRPITVTPMVVTLKAPASVAHGSMFQVAWTGPNGPQDYVTIVAAGSPEGTYNSYAYTQNGSPVTLTAPGTPGNYEIWYASDRIAGTFGKISIKVT